MTGEHSNTGEALATEKESHTPGPWVCFYKDKYKEWHVGVPLSRGSMKLALFPDGCPTDNPGADCRLIAAAPELLKALKEVIAISDRKHDAWDAAHAAIDKAEGRDDDSYPPSQAAVIHDNGDAYG
jgi:hypothetical protein